MHKLITIPGSPVAAHRPRFSRKLGRAYDSQRDVRDCMTWHIASQWDGDAVDEAIALDVTFHIKIPKATSKKKRALMIEQPCLKHWDVDNGLKILLDAMNGVCFKDDSSVWSVTAKKVWSEDPRTEISITCCS